MDLIERIATPEQFRELQLRMGCMSNDFRNIIFEEIKRSPTEFLNHFFNDGSGGEMPNLLEEESVHIERGYDDPEYMHHFNESIQVALSRLEFEKQRNQEDLNKLKDSNVYNV